MDLFKLQEKLEYKFKNKNLLELALTHSSYSNENREYGFMNNERLEFLGDSVLSLAVSNYIFNNYPSLPEGEMTKIRASTVCESSLKQFACKLEISKYLKLGKGEEGNGGRTRSSILADAMEAIIGAIYIDGGFETVEKFILSNLVDFIKSSIKGNGVVDYKTKLQEILQKNGDVKIVYQVIETTGPDHNKKFKVQVTCDNKKLSEGIGHSKKEAEQDCAKNVLINRNFISNVT